MVHVMYYPQFAFYYQSYILCLKAMLESERCAIEEQDKMRKQQMLLGPSSALASSQNAPLPPSPA